MVAFASGKGKDKKEEETDRSVAEGQPPPFNPTAKFFLRLFRDYQGQRADKMKALRTFARGSDESLREAHTRLKRLIITTHDVTEQQAVQHWYIILDKELKTLVRNEALQMEEPPSLRFVFRLRSGLRSICLRRRLPWVSSGARRSLLKKLR
jgi:hypothetical protein